MEEIELYRRVLRRDPGSPLFVDLARELFRRQMYQEAVETCRQGLQFHPQELRARVILGLSHLRLGHLERAETELLKAKELLEDNADLYQGLAELYEGKGMTARAQKYRRCFDTLKRPEEGGAEKMIQEVAVEEADADVATVTMAELYVQQGHLEKAAAVYRRILETAPGTVGVEDRLAALEKRIAARRQKRKLLEALQQWQQRLRGQSTRQAGVGLESGGVGDFPAAEVVAAARRLLVARERDASRG